MKKQLRTGLNSCVSTLSQLVLIIQGTNNNTVACVMKH